MLSTFNIPNLILSYLIIIIIFANFIVPQTAANNNNNKPKPIFILGDSTADVGTNNHLLSKAKANFPHNGIDFPNSSPTGRFSNGFNTADSLGTTTYCFLINYYYLFI